MGPKPWDFEHFSKSRVLGAPDGIQNHGILNISQNRGFLEAPDGDQNYGILNISQIESFWGPRWSPKPWGEVVSQSRWCHSQGGLTVKVVSQSRWCHSQGGVTVKVVSQSRWCHSQRGVTMPLHVTMTMRGPEAPTGASGKMGIVLL